MEIKNKTNLRDKFAKILKKNNKITGSRRINVKPQKVKLENNCIYIVKILKIQMPEISLTGGSLTGQNLSFPYAIL